MKHSQSNLTSVFESKNGNMCEAVWEVSYHTVHCGQAHIIIHNVTIHSTKCHLCFVIIT